MDRRTAEATVKGYLEQYLVGKGINTRKKFKCLSPQHNDTSPSMEYDRKRNKAHCFACGADYSILDLIAIDYNIPETDTAGIFKKAYSLYGIEVDGYQNQPKQQNTDKGAHMDKEEQVTSFKEFYTEAHSHIKETSYATERGLSPEIIERFNLGYVAAWRHPKSPKTPATPRLIIPIGEYAYIARDTRSEIPEEQSDYKKSKAKGKEAVSWTFNRQAIETATQPIFIVEGELDALSVIDVGGEAVAIGSTSNVKRFLSELKEKKPSQPLIIALDNDTAGRDTTEKLAKGLTELGILYYTDNPSGSFKDCNEALQHSREELTRAIDRIKAEVEEEAGRIEQEEKKAYLQNSAYSHLQEFINGIANSVNTEYIPTGFKKFDALLDGGLYEGLVTIGAISSLGKTSLILQICDQIAQSGKDVLIFSLEMARTELMSRSISRHTILEIRQNGGDIRNAKTARGITTGSKYYSYNPVELELINKAIMSYSSYAEHIFISEGLGDIGVSQIAETVKKHISITGNRPLVVIDYLQLLAPYNERYTDKQNTDKAVLELKRLSRDCKIPVIAISSLNRQSYKEKIDMDAFKESGAIEYSSDVLLGFQLTGAGTSGFDAKEEKRKNPRAVEVIILKNRNGATGEKVEFSYYTNFNLFVEK